MTDKFHNNFRIPSARAQWWDYHWAGAYFITICTQNREHYFGEIVDGKMELSETGEIVETEWLKTFEIRADMNLWMGEFVVMPNHFHAIIGIGENAYNMQRDNRDNNNEPHNQFGPQSKNLASIIRGFKSSVTMAARAISPHFQWQSRFYDHIVHDNESFKKKSNYIINNPVNWQEDKFFSAKQNDRKLPSTTG